MYQYSTPRLVKKVIVAAKVTKNSAKETVPITYLEFLPFVNKVEVTIGPQPPPPKASKNPPENPKKLNFLIFLRRGDSA